MSTQTTFDSLAGQDTATSIEAERRARRTWGTIIVGFLGLQIAIGVSAIALSLSDPSAAVVPHYYQAAVNWDATRRARQLAPRLGWQVQTSVAETSGAERELRVVIADKQAEQISGLRVHAHVYHHAQAAHVVALQLSESTPGTYVGRVPLTQSGLWQLDLRIEGEHGIAELSRSTKVH